MSGSEAEMLHEAEELKLGKRQPFDSSRQATYEDSVEPANEDDWEREDF